MRGAAITVGIDKGNCIWRERGRGNHSWGNEGEKCIGSKGGRRCSKVHWVSSKCKWLTVNWYNLFEKYVMVKIAKEHI